MRKNIISIISGVFCTGVLFIASCTKQDHFYKDYIIERIYTGKPDSIWVEPGDKRALIGWLTPKDAQSKEMVIRYGEDSVVVAIDHALEEQSVIIENLEERDYIFNAYTSDRIGHRSVPIELAVPIFGDNYRASANADRNLSHTVVFPHDSIALVFNNLGQAPTLFGADVTYTDQSGVAHQTFSPASEAVHMLYDADPNQPITVTTVYRPHENALDNFYRDQLDVDLVETKRTRMILRSGTWQSADYVDFNLARVLLEREVTVAPKGHNIDVCYVLGNSGRGNLMTVDVDANFTAFAAGWRDIMSTWAVRNSAQIKRLISDAGRDLYDSLDDTDREQMKAAFENSGSTHTSRVRVSPMATGTVILMHSIERDLYVAFKVIEGAPPAAGTYGAMEIEFKVSRPE